MKLNSLFNNRIPVFLAPMAGVTDAPFRELVSKFGVSATVSEMISSEALTRNSRKTYKRLVDSNNVNIVQIMGSNPKLMSQSAKISEDNGADIVDINMGCPVKKIVNNNSGAALLKDERLAVAIAEMVVKSVKVPVTVKMRLGWDSSSKNFRNLAKQFESVGVRMISIHCRTRTQMYSGIANWKEICDLEEIIQIPYLVNGSICNYEDAQHALTLSQAQGIMIGRAALGHPWFLNQILKKINFQKEVPSPSLEDRYKIIMEHFQNTLSFYGVDHGIKIFRKQFCWYSSGMSGAANFRDKINQATDVHTIELLVNNFYANHF